MPSSAEAKEFGGLVILLQLPAFQGRSFFSPFVFSSYFNNNLRWFPGNSAYTTFSGCIVVVYWRFGGSRNHLGFNACERSRVLVLDVSGRFCQEGEKVHQKEAAPPDQRCVAWLQNPDRRKSRKWLLGSRNEGHFALTSREFSFCLRPFDCSQASGFPSRHCFDGAIGFVIW